MPDRSLLLAALLVVGAGLLLGHGANQSGQAQEATPLPARWHVHLVDIYEGYGDPTDTAELINAELATLDQRCIDSVEFIGLGRNQRPAVSVVLHC